MYVSLAWEGIYSSDDRGATWVARSEGLDRRLLPDLELALEPSNSERLFAGTMSLGLFRSTDGSRGCDDLLSPDEIPRIIDPPSGLIWAANQQMVGGEYLIKMGACVHQIRDQLEALEAPTVAQMLELQLDDRSIPLRRTTSRTDPSCWRTSPPRRWRRSWSSTPTRPGSSSPTKPRPGSGS